VRIRWIVMKLNSMGSSRFRLVMILVVGALATRNLQAAPQALVSEFCSPAVSANLVSHPGASALAQAMTSQGQRSNFVEDRVSSALPKIRLYLLWGQSHMGGAQLSSGKISDLSSPVPYWGVLDAAGHYQAVRDCYIFDKGMRSNPLDSNQQDMHPGHLGELAGLQDLTVGHTWLAVPPVSPNNTHQHGNNNYPWLHDHQVPDPLVGPETAFAQRIQEATGDIVVVVKMVVGGANVVNRDVVVVAPSTCNWPVRSIAPSYYSRSTRADGYYQLMLDSYWQEAIALARQLPEHVQGGYPLVVGGVASLIGTSDSRCVYVEDFREHYFYMISDLRADMGVPSAGGVPYLVVQSPLSAGTYVRDTARNMPAIFGGPVGTLDSSLFLPAIGHASADGTSDLGSAMADWFLNLNLVLQELP
jgi:hypothetical protein